MIARPTTPRPGTSILNTQVIAQGIREDFPLAFDQPEPHPPRAAGPGSMDYDRWQWKVDHPKHHHWIIINCARSKFAYSLCRALHVFGMPTSAQQAALNRIVGDPK